MDILDKEQKKTVTKEEFFEKMTMTSDKKLHANKEKKYWHQIDEKNATKRKYRW